MSSPTSSTKAEGEKPATPPQLPPKTQSKHQYQTQHQRNLERTELRRRQHSEEHSPNRSPETGPEVNGQKAAQRNTETEKREGRGSPPPLNRPLSFPLDAKAGRYCMLHSHSSPLPLTPFFTTYLSTVVADVW